jgi:hypothetical protein
VDRFLFAAMTYPATHGFVPGTLGDDGDPLDALVLTPAAPVVPGAVIRSRPIGVLLMEDENGQENGRTATTGGGSAVLPCPTTCHCPAPMATPALIENFPPYPRWPSPCQRIMPQGAAREQPTRCWG